MRAWLLVDRVSGEVGWVGRTKGERRRGGQRGRAMGELQVLGESFAGGAAGRVIVCDLREDLEEVLDDVFDALWGMVSG